MLRLWGRGFVATRPSTAETVTAIVERLEQIERETAEAREELSKLMEDESK